jgi:hypothetical protein
MSQAPIQLFDDRRLLVDQDGCPIRAVRTGASGRRCFGYSTDGKDLVPDEAAVIRAAAAEFLAGASLRSLVMQMNERGLQTSSHGVWQTITLRRLFSNRHHTVTRWSTRLRRDAP